MQLYNKIKCLCLLLLISSFLLSCKDNNLNKKTYDEFAKRYELPYKNANYALYNDIISNVEMLMKLFDSTHTNKNDDEVIGKTQYIGYQLYDINDDGILDLFIFRYAAYGYPYIDRAYTISDNNVVELKYDTSSWSDISSCYGTGATNDDAWFALNDGKLANLGGKYGGISGVKIVDMRLNIIDDYYWETLAPPMHQRTINGIREESKEITAEVLNAKINSTKKIIAFFPTRIITELIPEK